MSNFALVSSADVSGIINVKKYRSKETGLVICFAHVDGPLVNGYFCLGMDIFIYILIDIFGRCCSEVFQKLLPCYKDFAGFPEQKPWPFASVFHEILKSSLSVNAF